MSHRSKEFMGIASEAEKNLRDVFGVPDTYKVIFAQGGATLQFSSVPLNMLGSKTKADYLITGQWGEKAHKECAKYGTPQAACNTKKTKFTSIPDPKEWTLDPEAAYVHYCANETVNGVEFSYTPDVGSVPLVADMSSNFCSKAIDVSKGFYCCPVEKGARSRMNVPFTIMGGNEEVEKKFLDEAKKHKLFTLAGHRSVGGCRASLYNGMPLEGVEK